MPLRPAVPLHADPTATVQTAVDDIMAEHPACTLTDIYQILIPRLVERGSFMMSGEPEIDIPGIIEERRLRA